MQCYSWNPVRKTSHTRYFKERDLVQGRGCFKAFRKPWGVKSGAVVPCVWAQFKDWKRWGCCPEVRDLQKAGLVGLPELGGWQGNAEAVTKTYICHSPRTAWAAREAGVASAFQRS